MLHTRIVVIAVSMFAWSAPGLAAARDSDTPAEQVRDALDAQDATLVLERLRESPGADAGLACVEVLMHEQVLGDLWRPPLARDDATPEVAAEDRARRDAGLADLGAEVTDLRAAHARCAAQTVRARPNASERAAFAARSATLDEFLALPEVDDDALATLDAPSELRIDFHTARELYDACESVPPAPPERAPLPGWRSTPVITSGLLTFMPLLGFLIVARTQHSLDGGFGALGAGISGLVGLTVGRSWLRGGSTLVWVGGLLTAGVLGTGALTLALHAPRRTHVFGVSMLAGGAIDLAWWIGGVVLGRRDAAAHEEWRRQLRPTVDVGSAHATVGLRGSF